jgi:hypothetical protein
VETAGLRARGVFDARLTCGGRDVAVGTAGDAVAGTLAGGMLDRYPRLVQPRHVDEPEHEDEEDRRGERELG